MRPNMLGRAHHSTCLVMVYIWIVYCEQNEVFVPHDLFKSLAFGTKEGTRGQGNKFFVPCCYIEDTTTPHATKEYYIQHLS